MSAEPNAPGAYSPGQPFPPPPPPPAKSGRGCFFWGCLVLLLLVLVFIGIVGVGIYIVRNEFTAPAPMPVPEYQPKPGEAEAVERRIQAFERGGAAPGQEARLELTAADLNALLSDGLRGLPAKAFARIDGDRLELDVSVSLEEVPFLSGRYFNGAVAVKPRVEEGALRLEIVSATANGQEVPRRFLKQLENSINVERLRGRGGRKSRLQEVLEKARTVEVKDGKIILER